MKIRDLRQGHWSWFSHRILDDFGAVLGPYGIAVYCALLRCSGKEQEAEPSVKEIAALVAVSERKVVEELQHLEQLGLIGVEKKSKGKGGGTDRNTYTLLDSPTPQASLFPEVAQSSPSNEELKEATPSVKELNGKEKDPRVHTVEMRLYVSIVKFYPHVAIRDEVIEGLRGVPFSEAETAFRSYMAHGGNPKSLKWLGQIKRSLNAQHEEWTKTAVNEDGSFQL